MLPSLFLPAVRDAVRCAAALDIRVLLVGALARDLCLSEAPTTGTRKTDDADLALMLDDWSELDTFFERCEPAFRVDRSNMRLRHRSTGIPVDVAPCGSIEEPRGRLRLRRSRRDLNLVGLAEAFDTASEVRVGDHGLLVPSPGAFVLLKLLSFHDRRAHRDLSDFGYVARRAPREDEAVWGDARLMEEFAEGRLTDADVHVWQLGVNISSTFSPEAVAAFREGLRLLESEEPFIRTLLTVEDGRSVFAPDERVAEADRLLQTLLVATNQVVGTAG